MKNLKKFENYLPLVWYRDGHPSENDFGSDPKLESTPENIEEDATEIMKLVSEFLSSYGKEHTQELIRRISMFA